MNNKSSILVVEDDAAIRNLITTTLKTHNYKYVTAANGETAILEAASHNPDVVLLDLGLPDMDGIEVIKKSVPGLICQLLLLAHEVKKTIKLMHWTPEPMIIDKAIFC